MIDTIIQNRLSSFKGLILDGDGVWFTGEEYRATLPDGQVIVMKCRHHHDGQGLSFLRAIGIRVLFATAEGEPLASVVKKINELPSVRSGDWPPVSVCADLKEQGTKIKSIEEWLKKEGLLWQECAYIGDDRTDWEAIQKAGLKVSPGNGRRIIKNIADITLVSEGGRGAIREFAELVLDVRGIDEATLSAF